MITSADVLVVDDEEALRSSVGDILRSAGYSVIEAEDGEAALEVLRNERVAVVVLDQRMPGATGIDILKTFSSPASVILMSAYQMSPEDRALVADKVFSVLLKPVAPRRLLEEVAAAYHKAAS